MEDTSKTCENKTGQTIPLPYTEEEASAPPPYPGEIQGSNIYGNPTQLLDGTKCSPYTGEVPQTNVTVVQTQRVVRVVNRPDPPIETFFGCSIFVMIFCCIPFGIVALVYASQQKSREAVGDFEGARRASSQAKCWSWAGFCVGLLEIVSLILWIFLSDPYY